MVLLQSIPGPDKLSLYCTLLYDVRTCEYTRYALVYPCISAAAALCVAILLFRCSCSSAACRSLLFVIVCRIAKFDAVVHCIWSSVFFLQTRFMFNSRTSWQYCSLDIPHTYIYALGNYGHARSRGGPFLGFSMACGRWGYVYSIRANLYPEKKWPCHPLLLFMGVSMVPNTWYVTLFE